MRGCHSWKVPEGPPTLWPRILGAWPQKPAPYRPVSAFSPGRVGYGYPLDLAQTDSSLRMPRLDLRTRRANLRSRRSGNWLPGSAACVSHSGLSILSMRPRSGDLQGGSLPPDHSHQPGSLAYRAVLRHAPGVAISFRGRDAGCPAPPAQIRTCALTHTAPTFGSDRGPLGPPYPFGRLCHGSPARCPARALASRIPVGHRPWLRQLRNGSLPPCSLPSSLLCRCQTSSGRTSSATAVCLPDAVPPVAR